jgi:D-aminopeptidase
LDARNLKRLAKRAWLGLGKTGGIASNGSGEYVIAFSTAEELRAPYESDTSLQEGKTLTNDAITPLFIAAIEATEEAILNSLFQAETMTGRNGHIIEALPLDKVKELLRKYGQLKE